MTAFFKAHGPSMLVGLIVFITHQFASPVAEPFKNNDETRQVMTGVFFRDALCDLPDSATDPKGYATRYYLQYPALGLIVWPPFFHMVEGVAMAVFGTSYATARGVLYAFAILAWFYAYRLTIRSFSPRIGAIGLAFLGFSPVAFDSTGSVLLEIPTLALVLGAIFHFERYLGDLRPRDALLACLFAACAALTRFDGVLLLPYVLIRLLAERQFRVLLNKPVIFGAVAALCLTVPYYLFTWQVYGTGIEAAAMTGTNANATAFFAWENFYLYPWYIPLYQLKWPATVLMALGLVVTLVRDRRAARPFVALIAATFITFVPFAEPAERHAIYWIPALAVFVALGIEEIARKATWWTGGAVLAFVLGYTAYEAVSWTGWYIRGNEPAANYVVANASGDRPVMVEGVLNGGFIFYTRRADADRKLTVLRADKVLYAVMSDPHGKYEEYAKTDAEVLAAIEKYDPEFIVVEQPQLLFEMPAAARLRVVLASHPDLFQLVETVPFESNHHVFRMARIEIYRKLLRNPHPTPPGEIPVLGLGRKVGR